MGSGSELDVIGTIVRSELKIHNTFLIFNNSEKKPNTGKWVTLCLTLGV